MRWVGLAMVACTPDLPAGWETAERVAGLLQGSCTGGTPSNERVAAIYQDGSLQVRMQDTVFRCEQRVVGFHQLTDDEAAVLVQPQIVAPATEDPCFCTYDLDINVLVLEVPPAQVRVYRRGDAWSGPHEPVLVGVVPVSVR